MSRLGGPNLFRFFAAMAILIGATNFAYAPPMRFSAPRVEPRPMEAPGRNESHSDKETRVDGGEVGGKTSAYSLRSGLTESQYRGLLDILADAPQWSRLEISKWVWGGKPVETKELFRFLNMFGNLLPTPELAIFLDPGEFGALRIKIIDAWGGRPRYAEVPSDKTLLEGFLESYRGKTLLLVGHVEGTAFVKQGADENSRGSYEVSDLVEKARAHDVLLVSIGCRTGDVGAPIGFVDNIQTDQVASFLRTLPESNATFGDLLFALQTIAPLRIDLAAVGDMLELVLTGPGNREPGVRAEIPLSTFSSSSASSGPSQFQTFEEFQQAIENRAAQYLMHDLPWGWIAFAGFAILTVGGYFDEIPSRKWFFVTKLRTEWAKLIKTTALGCAWVGMAIMLVSAVYLFAVDWLGGAVIATALIALFYIGAWTKSSRIARVDSGISE